MSSEQEEIVIPILDLEKFVFSPPGPMGWELSEYEQQKNIVLNESSVLENLAIIKEIELEELPKIGLLDLEEESPQKTTIIDEVKDEEVQKTRKTTKTKKKKKKRKKTTIELEGESSQKTTIIDEVKDEETQNAIEIEKPKVKVKIITSDQPLKSPWIANLVKSAKENE
jgi:HD superfamily phosphohydrolase